MDNLDKKLKTTFPNLVVNKRYAIRSEIRRLPRFISEYLIMKFTENDKLNESALHEFLKKYYVTPEEKNSTLFELKKSGGKEIMDEFYVEMRIAKEKIKRSSSITIASDIVPGLKIPSLMINDAWIKENVLNENGDLLKGGTWGIGRLEIPKKVLVGNLTFSDDFPPAVISDISTLFKEIFISKLEEAGFEIVISDPESPVFVSKLKEVLDRCKEEGISTKENLDDEILVSLCHEFLANYIFKPLLKYQENRIIFQMNYFSLIERKWKNFESKDEIVLNNKNKLRDFLTVCIMKFMVKEKIEPSFFITLTKFKPYQISSMVIDSVISRRKEFNTEEWTDVIIRSLGLEPQNYSPRQKLLLLFRLVPLVENNVNLIELGPKATGKTYIYRNASLYTRIFAGGKVSPAQIFYHGTYKMHGEIVRRDCIVFDELSKIEFPEEMISKLKDYMVDGYFERLALSRTHSECGLVFIDNVDIEFNANFDSEFLPPILSHDTAFLDRIHGLISGWELPKIQQTEKHLARGYGLAADVLCEFFHQMRDKGFQEIIDDKIELVGEKITIRDERGIKKTIAGLLKIIFPDGNISDKELGDIVSLAIEMRQNINKILYELEPSEFLYKKIGYKLKNLEL